MSKEGIPEMTLEELGMDPVLRAYEVHISHDDHVSRHATVAPNKEIAGIYVLATLRVREGDKIVVDEHLKVFKVRVLTEGEVLVVSGAHMHAPHIPASAPARTGANPAGGSRANHWTVG